LSAIPLPVRRFLERRIESVEQLEVLLLLYQFADRSWNAAAVAEALRLLRPAAARSLEALGRRDLLDVRIGDDMWYRFSPATPELTATVRQVADAYREYRTPVMAFVTARRRRPLQDFADAFRIREDDDHG
jgi:hypothetical protein